MSSKKNPLDEYYIRDGVAYSVARLIASSKDLPVFDMPMKGVDLSDITWDGCTLNEIARHVSRVYDADLDYPIILDWDGCVADGRHRIIKALVKGLPTIKAVRLTEELEPDYIERD